MIIISILCVVCILFIGILGMYYYYVTYAVKSTVNTDYTLYTPGYAIMSSSIPGVSPIENVSTLTDCKTACASNDSCQTFKYNVTAKQCTLQQQAAAPTNQFQENPVVTGVGYKLTNNKFTYYNEFTANDIYVPNIGDPIAGVTQEECQKKCVDDTTCLVYKYQTGANADPTTSKCQLKKLMSNSLYTHGNLDRKQLER